MLISETTERLIGGSGGPLEGLSLSDLGHYRLKDFEQAVRLYQLVGPGLQADFPPVRAERVSRTKRRRLLIGLIPLVGAIAAGLAVLLSRGGGGVVTVPPNALAVIDPQQNKVVAAIPVGIQPGPIATGEGALWVGNLQDQTLTRIDPETQAVKQTIPLIAPPSDVAVGSGSVWVAYSHPLRIARFAPGGIRAFATTAYHQRCPAGPGLCSASLERDLRRNDFNTEARGMAFGGGSLWTVGQVGGGYPLGALIRINASSGRVIGINDRLLANGSSGITVGNGAVWISAVADDAVWRISARTDEVTGSITVGDGPSDVAFGDGSVWVATRFDSSLWRLDAPEAEPAKVGSVIRVGSGPLAVAVGKDAVWVANNGDGTVSHIDPRTNKVVATIYVGNTPSGIAIANGRVWVTVQAPPM